MYYFESRGLGENFERWRLENNKKLFKDRFEFVTAEVVDFHEEIKKYSHYANQ